MEDFPVVLNVGQKYFDPSVDQRSPLVDDYVRTVHHDEKGGEYVTYEKFDSAEYQKELGPVENWSLDSLIKAGIDPRFGIHTTSPSRMEGASVMNDFVEKSESLYKEINENAE